ncbi:MAG: FCD domain-containing protein [Acidimicrobiales bacterium]|nr:FCD domain-containing protein [Acidimicrobiales bacterium]
MRRSSRALQQFDQLVQRCACGQDRDVDAFLRAPSSSTWPLADDTIDHTREILDTMHLLESAAIALGAAALTSSVVRQARGINDELRVSGNDAAHLARRFHRSLLSACPNDRMLELLAHEVSLTTPCGPPFAVGDAERDRCAIEHEVILDLIASGAPRRELERSLRQHAYTSPLCSMGY